MYDNKDIEIDKKIALENEEKMIDAQEEWETINEEELEKIEKEKIATEEELKNINASDYATEDDLL